MIIEMFTLIEALVNIITEAALFEVGLNDVWDFDKPRQEKILEVNKS